MGAWSQRALATAPGWGAAHGHSMCGGRGDAVAIRPMAAVLGNNGAPGQRQWVRDRGPPMAFAGSDSPWPTGSGSESSQPTPDAAP